MELHWKCDIYGIKGGYFFDLSKDGESQFTYQYDGIENGRLGLRYQCRRGEGRVTVENGSTIESLMICDYILNKYRSRTISIPFGFVCKDCGKPWYESSKSTADQKT